MCPIWANLVKSFVPYLGKYFSASIDVTLPTP